MCHAYASDDRNNQRSIWAEGVMDWAAVFFFEKWSRRLKLPGAIVKSRGDDLWVRRMAPTRYTGRVIADTLVDWLTEEPSIQRVDVARVVAANFALEVNGTVAPLWAKDALASRIATIWSDKPLQEAFRAWRAIGAAPAAAMLS